VNRKDKHVVLQHNAVWRLVTIWQEPAGYTTMVATCQGIWCYNLDNHKLRSLLLWTLQIKCVQS